MWNKKVMVLLFIVLGVLVMSFGSYSMHSDNTSNELVGFVEVGRGQSLAEVAKQIGSNMRSLLIDREVAVTEDVVLPDNITLFFVPPGRIKTAAGATITIQGAIQSPAVPCFAGEGEIVIENGHPIYADWWGSDGQAIQKAINACSAGKILLLNKIYKTSNTIKGKRGIILQGIQSHEIWTEDTGTVIDYVGQAAQPVLDFQGARIFGVMDLKIHGHDKASHGLITANQGLHSRAKYSKIQNLIIYNCDVGIDLGGTDDITLRAILIQWCGTAVKGSHTNVGFDECAFIVSRRAGVEIAAASKGSFYKCLWTGNKVDLLFNSDPHPGSIYTFRDCWFENCTDTIIRKAPEIDHPIGMLALVFDQCILHSLGQSLMDCTDLGAYPSKIVFNDCHICPTSKSRTIVDPSGQIKVIGAPLPPIEKDNNVYEYVQQLKSVR